MAKRVLAPNEVSGIGFPIGWTFRGKPIAWRKEIDQLVASHQILLN
jgi:hypothetical protein